MLLLEPNSIDEESKAVVATEKAVDDVDGEDGRSNTEAKETLDDTDIAGTILSDVLTVVETVHGLAVADLSFVPVFILGDFSVGDPKLTRLAAAALARY